MDFRSRSESKIRSLSTRIPLSRTSLQNESRIKVGRSSLQSENALSRRPRSNSLETRTRIPGSSAKPRSSSDERKSGLGVGWGNNRRSSVNFNESKIKDTRPLNDKSYQKKKIMELVEYLNETNFNHPVTLAKLMQPSKKDFENVFEHLILFFYPHYKVKKIEEEAPKMLKNLCYPFPPSKTAFTYVARTNWPSLLGVLLFLMDLLKFTDNFDQKLFFTNAEAERPEEHAILMEYILNCYFQQDENEEKDRQVFAEIIRRRMPFNIQELQVINQQLKAEQAHLDEEIEKKNSLIEQSRQLDGDIQQFEKYFADMKEYRAIKQAGIKKVSDRLSAKESELEKLKETLAQKQALYDAQGFDGKKQKVFFESQKRELLERLESKKGTLKDVQNQCWEAEVLFTQTMDKVSSVCEEFNGLSSKLSKMASTVLDPICDIKDPQIQNLCSLMELELPVVFQLHPTMRDMVQKCVSHRNILKNFKQKLDSTCMVFNGLAIKQNQKLHEVSMKNKELAMKLKVASSTNNSHGSQFSSKEKQAEAEEELKAAEAECERILKQLDKLKADSVEAEKELLHAKEELKELNEIKRDKKQMYDDYLIYQMEIYAEMEAAIKESEQSAEVHGEKCYEATVKALNKINMSKNNSSISTL